MNFNLFRRSSGGRSSQEALKKILLVDDEATFVKLTKMSLEQLGPFEVCTETRAREAIAAALRFRPDFILLDVMMPDGDGGQLAAQMQEYEELKNIPIVFVTAAVKKDETGNRARRIGGRTYLAKPIRAEELVECIESISEVSAA